MGFEERGKEWSHRSLGRVSIGARNGSGRHLSSNASRANGDSARINGRLWGCSSLGGDGGRGRARWGLSGGRLGRRGLGRLVEGVAALLVEGVALGLGLVLEGVGRRGLVVEGVLLSAGRGGPSSGSGGLGARGEGIVHRLRATTLSANRCPARGEGGVGGLLLARGNHARTADGSAARGSHGALVGERDGCGQGGGDGEARHGGGASGRRGGVLRGLRGVADVVGRATNFEVRHIG